MMLFCAELCSAKATAAGFYFAEFTRIGRCTYCRREETCFVATGRRELEIEERDLRKLREAFFIWIDNRIAERDAKARS